MQIATILLTWHCGGHSASQCSHSCHGDLVRIVLFRAGVAGGHHVGFEQRSLQIDVVVRQCFVDSCQHLADFINTGRDVSGRECVFRDKRM